MGKKLYYYVTGHTAGGFVNYLETNIKGINNVYVVKHDSHKIKTALFQQLIAKLTNEYDLEVLLSPLGHGDMEGIIVRKSNLAIVDAQIFTEKRDHSQNVTVLDLNVLLETSPSQHSNPLLTYHKMTTEAHNLFQMGLDIHDELEEIYINEMDFSKANDLSDVFIQQLLKDVVSLNQSPKTYKRMFGTNTPEGAINIIPELIKPIRQRYFIKGRAGTGKSTFMKRIASACEDYGFDVEMYYCSFDPGSIDMVLVRQLEFCIFDSTDPHEFFPDRQADSIVDMYEALITPGTDERYADEIQTLNRQYKSYMTSGIDKLKEARTWLDDVFSDQSDIGEDTMDHIWQALKLK
ncbi:hypothetical protein [Lentibacillus saliphilus]|uniref:hypothetical protein n=1 Tax=Lentibacillus saliphilus TaxID=2737028 RepID=UPI001C30AD0E|nr:hypothetical protein [Lentibacillus saliphilus]